ncbi:hypothetical protein HRbin22_02100 [Candidatus Thermoflexus japonica]|uniref:Uncharacterized protein n=1 Tax=Candidatus Thermoflexus japonica TaxID=2035417 RepID=A0A2H5Y8S8_9CHLR|nr:hypothetical protein HRbin22_02100 [Candidatus Thermoflexus japonica]
MHRLRWIAMLAMLIVACEGGRPPAPTPPAATPTITATPMPSPTVPPSPTATATPAPSPTPIPSPTATSCAAPAIPAPSGANRVAEGCLHVHLEAGQIWEKDGFDLAAAVGYQGAQPPCAAFFLSLSWKVTGGDGQNVQWTVVQQGVETPAGQGNQGGIRGGCGFYRLHNNGPSPVDLDVRVAVDLMGWP